MVSVISVSPSLHKQEDRDEDRVDRDRKMRVVGRTEYERQRCTGRDHRPVGRRIQSVTPDVGPGHLTAVKVDHCRIKLGKGQFLRDRYRRGLRLLVTLSDLFRKGFEGIRDGSYMYFFVVW